MEGLPFTFWIAPATLVFRDVKEFKFDIEPIAEDSFEIEEIERTESENGYLWAIITRREDIQFFSEGYEQFIRQDPFFEFEQAIPHIDRYGYSLERTTNQENPNLNREDVVSRRAKNLEKYEMVKKRHLKRQEKDNLQKARENNEIDTKNYLLKKNEINDIIDFYDYWLKSTVFEK